MISISAILKAKLLIVDDLEANVLLLERLLSSAGYSNISSTPHPTEVMDLHRKNRYDLILLDLNMPEIGHTLLSHTVPAARAQRPLVIAAASQRARGPLLGRAAGHKDTCSELVGVDRSAEQQLAIAAAS